MVREEAMTNKKKIIMRWDAILKRLPIGRELRAAEIGVWSGKTSYRILAARPQLTLYLVDRWRPPAGDDSYFSSGAEMARRPVEEYVDAYEETVRKVAPFKKRAIVFMGDSAFQSVFVEDVTLDLVFVDGDHSYKGCRRDTEAWWPKVKEGGWIGGHDYAHPDQGEVQRAVDEFFKGFNVELDGNRTWWVRKV